ncbi:MAG: hypothetical protein R3E64_11025 [Halioglobus sp.]
MSSGSDRDATMRALPEIATRFEQLYQSLWTQPHIPASTLELCRLRLAQLHRCDVEWQRRDHAVPAPKRDALQHWPDDEQFSAAERACLAFTEVYAMDTQSITDQLADAVKAHHGDAGLVMLVEALGILDGMTRLSLLWQLPVPSAMRSPIGD